MADESIIPEPLFVADVALFGGEVAVPCDPVDSNDLLALPPCGKRPALDAGPPPLEMGDILLLASGGGGTVKNDESLLVRVLLFFFPVWMEGG